MFKRSIFCFFAVLTLFDSLAQKLNTDSLWNVATTTQNDSLRFDIMVQLNDYYQGVTIDSNFYYARKILDFAEKTKTPKCIAYATLTLGYPFIRIGDYKSVQERIVKATKLIEENPDDEIEARINNFRSLIEPDNNKKIAFLQKAIMCNERSKKFNRISLPLYSNMSRVFVDIHNLDSALFYAQRANEVAIKTNDSLNILLPESFMRVYLELKQFDLASVYCKKAMHIAIALDRTGGYTRAYSAMARFYEGTGQIDSALHYRRLVFVGSGDEIRAKLVSSKWIYKYYRQKGISDSAMKYMDAYITANDTLNNINKVVELQKQKFEEDLRQHDLETARQEAKEDRNHNIQLAIIAIAILSITILFLLISRSILVSHRVVAFLSIVALLVVFEFINLMIHPFLERYTNHSPILMLLALVAIAALIVPLHHRLEKWTTKKLVEKNKAIRLANAKKTIEELENNPNTDLS